MQKQSKNWPGVQYPLNCAFSSPIYADLTKISALELQILVKILSKDQLSSQKNFGSKLGGIGLEC